MLQLFAISLFLVSVFARTPLTYWVDNSCSKYKIRGTQISVFHAGLTEAMRFASSADKMARKVTAKPQLEYFSKLFKLIDKSTTQQVSVVMSSVAGITIASHTEANVRFYCDNDASGPGKRWTQMAKEETKKFGHDAWEDKVNGIVTGALLCHGDDRAGTYRNTYEKHTEKSYNGQKERVTVTVCDRALDMNDPLQVAALFYRTASDHVVAVQHSGNGQPILTNLGTEQLFQMTSKIILHELMHFPYYQVLGQQSYYKYIDDFEYGFPFIVDQISGKCIQNADNFAYFGILAGLYDPPQGQQAWQANMVTGQLSHVSVRRRRTDRGIGARATGSVDTQVE